MSVDHDRERLLQDDTAAEALLRWAQRHDDALAEVVALARLGPDAGRWQRIARRAEALDAVERARLDAELAGWPDAMRLAPERWAWPEVQPVLAVARALKLHPVADRLYAPRQLAASAHAASLTALTVHDLRPHGGWRVETLLKSPHLCRLESLYLPRNGLDAAHVAALVGTLQLTRLRELGLGGNPLGVDGARALVHAPVLANLTALSVGECQLGDEGLGVILEAPFAARLTALSIDDNDITDEGLAALATPTHLSCLEHLSLSYNMFGSEGIAALCGADHLRGLRTLQLAGAWFESADELDALLGAPLAGSLRELDLSAAELDDALVAALAAAPALRHLERLVLDGNDFGPDGARALATSPNLTALTQLVLTMNTLGDAGAAALAEAGPACRLERLDLGNNQIGDDGARALARAGGLERVTHLDLRGNQIGADGVGALLEREPPCRELVLGHNPIGDEGARLIAASRGAAGLERLDLLGTGLSDDGRQALATSPYLSRALRYGWLSQLPTARLETIAAELGVDPAPAGRLTRVLDALES